MLSRTLVKSTSPPYVKLDKNSVAFISLLGEMLSNSMVSLLSRSKGVSDDPPPSHPLELKTCVGNSSLMANKILLSIVFKAFVCC